LAGLIALAAQKPEHKANYPWKHPNREKNGGRLGAGELVVEKPKLGHASSDHAGCGGHFLGPRLSGCQAVIVGVAPSFRFAVGFAWVGSTARFRQILDLSHVLLEGHFSLLCVSVCLNDRYRDIGL
jgi:hypothetical protein